MKRGTQSLSSTSDRRAPAETASLRRPASDARIQEPQRARAPAPARARAHFARLVEENVVGVHIYDLHDFDASFVSFSVYVSARRCLTSARDARGRSRVASPFRARPRPLTLPSPATSRKSRCRRSTRDMRIPSGPVQDGARETATRAPRTTDAHAHTHRERERRGRRR